jgi:hypothetical protein
VKRKVEMEVQWRLDGGLNMLRCCRDGLRQTSPEYHVEPTDYISVYKATLYTI